MFTVTVALVTGATELRKITNGGITVTPYLPQLALYSSWSAFRLHNTDKASISCKRKRARVGARARARKRHSC
jgi:hypothetical protein